MTLSTTFAATIAAITVLSIAAYSAQADCYVADYDLSSIPTATLTIPLNYQGQLGNFNYTWVINLCSVVNQPPAGASSCSDTNGDTLRGYISEYGNNCHNTWSTINAATAGTYSLEMNLAQTATSYNPYWTATVTLICAGTDPALVSTGPAMVTGMNEQNFAFTFTTSAVCGAGPPPPPGPTPVPLTPVPGTPVTPTPPIPTDCIVAGYDLSSIPTATLAIPLNYQGGLEYLTWVVNLCSVVNEPPAGAFSCRDANGNTLPGYISEYESTYCQNTWCVIKAAMAGTNSLEMNLAQTAGSYTSYWTATVTLICAGTDPALVSTGPVLLTGNDAPNFAFTFTTSAVCPFGPVPTTAAPTTAAPATPQPAVPTPPQLPQFFQGEFTEYTSYKDTVGPPYVNGVPPAPLVASRGRVYYDWTLRNMIEVREDYCVNIFGAAGQDFPCTFQNVNGTSYLITYNRTTALPPCCVFGKPWYPPSPTFLRDNVTADFYSVTPWNAGEANWFIVPSIAPPTGPFFYSFDAWLPSERPQVYTSFAFPGISGWVQQQFHNINDTRPDESVWALPSICLPVETLPSCDFFGSGSSTGGNN